MADNTVLPVGTGGDTIATDDIGGVKYQRVKPSWGSDGSAVDVDALNPLPISVNAANFIISTANSSTAQLTASSTFTGTIETALSQPSISILLTSDQPTTITVKQYIDLAGTRAAPNIVFTVAAGAGFSYSFTLNGNYVQVTAQNTGASTTTTFNLNVAYGTIQSANQAGNAPVDLASMGGVVVAGTAASTQPLFTTPALTVADRSTGASGATAPSSVQNCGAVFTSTLPTVTTGQMVAMQATARGEQLTALSVGAVQSTIKAASTAAATTDTALVVSFAGANSATRIGDGTNNVNIKAGSTAAAFADTALTVDLRPGGVLPVAAASADALANPTITQLGADNMVFNGTSWDRLRGMSLATTTGDTGAKTATGNGATQTNVGNKGVAIVIVLGTVSGTSPTCVFKLQTSVDGGTNWVDLPGATTASLTATGTFGISVYPGQVVTAGTTTTGTTATANGVIPRTWRVVWTIGGTTPSFTITSITYNYLQN